MSDKEFTKAIENWRGLPREERQRAVSTYRPPSADSPFIDRFDREGSMQG